MRIRQDKQTAARIREVAQGAAERIGSTVGPVAEAQSAELRARLAPAVEHASAAARDRVERGLRAAAPRVESASQAVAPHVEKAVDKARERFVDDIVPRLAEAVAAAASAGAAAMQSAGDSAGERLQAVADKAESAAAPKKKRRGARFLLLAVLAAAIGAGLASWKRRVKDTDDLWRDTPTAVPPVTQGSANHTAGQAAADAATIGTTAGDTTGGDATGATAGDTASGSFGTTAASAPAVDEGLEEPPVEETPAPVDSEELTLNGAEEPATQTITTKAARSRKVKPEGAHAAEAMETADEVTPADPA